MPVFASSIQARPWLVARAGSRFCALSLADVIEVVRLLPVEPIAGAPPFVLGLCIHRGAPVAVVDAGLLFGEHTERPDRLVAVKAEGRTIGLAFSAVIGLRSIPSDRAEALPPLLSEAGADVIKAIAKLDARLLHILDTARLALDFDVEGAAAERGAL